MLRHATLLKDALISRSPHRRRLARYQLIEALTRRQGFRIYNPFLDWIVNAESYRQAFSEQGLPACVMRERHFTLWSIAQATAHLAGDTAECGVFKGSGSRVICQSRAHLPEHRHHCFDSFAGLSDPAAEDRPGHQAAYQWQQGDLSCSLEEVKENLREFGEMIIYHPGWIPERFVDVSDRQFSLVHIDVDLIDPTRDSLEFFYPRLVPGGIVVCDDYGSTWCPGAKKACDEFCAAIPQQHVIHLTTGQGLIIRSGERE